MPKVVTQLALLRGINVGGRNRMAMKELVGLCEEWGAKSVRTILQTGNVVFEGGGSGKSWETKMEAGIEERFGFAVPVVVRSAEAFQKVLEGNPMMGEAESEPSRVILYLAKEKPAKFAVEELMERAQAGERAAVVEGGLWIHFPNGIGRSKLTPAVIDRAMGSAATGRNWKTLWKIRALMDE